MKLSIPNLIIVGAALVLGVHCREIQAVDKALPVDLAKLPAAAKQKIEFNRDIRPILSENCSACHGPDSNKRKAGLRLDTKEGAFARLESGNFATVPGKVAESQILARIITADEDDVMPPVKTGKKLTAAQIGLLRAWIEQGAPWQQHWSLIVPQRPPLPAVKSKSWPRNPIDYFILARLEKDGLKPSPEAGRATLIRRLSFDLTGLPPTPAEVDAFVADKRPDAYERLVDTLLASPHYGERMALDWLDAARFADTHGYHIDAGRDMTKWREWVIDAYNHNMPFDQFTVEQIGGDLLPNATLDQKVASGFNRNHMINFEGGAIPEEYQTAYIMDRVKTTGTVWLGLTIGCCQCHDHKYDPLTQKDFYQFYAFFNNVPENGLDGSKGNAMPLMKVPTRDQQQRLEQFVASVKQTEQKLAGPLPGVDAAQVAWERTVADDRPVTWTVLEPTELKSADGATFTKRDDKSVLVGGPNPEKDIYTIAVVASVPDVTAIRLEALPNDSLAAKGPGRSGNGNLVMTKVRLAAGATPIKFKSASSDFSQKDFPVSNAIDDKPGSGWAIYPEVGKPHFAVFEAEHPVNGPLTVSLEFQSTFGQHTIGRLRLAVTNSKDPHGGSQVPANLRQILAIAADKRSDAQKVELQKFYRTTISPEIKQLNDELAKLKQQEAELNGQIRSTMVMQELPQPRETFMLVRGQYDKRGDKVAMATPSVLPPLPSNMPTNRLALAKWLVDPANPLTARVAVNRYWQMYFGTGIVKTAEDFGTQGEWPSHPELLDWLATDFVASNWNVKQMQRLIVTSATYRQSSATTPDLIGRDPENRLLAHGPRLRLQAEFIRDQALAVSGLLNPEIGGASVNPYQPPGLWEELMSRADGANWTAQTYTQSHGKDLYKRTMYTFWKRTSPPPTLTTFDAPDRETCTVRRPRTNTPLQALVLMNDPTYLEASRKLAERLMIEMSTTEQRITYAFRLLLSRAPKDGEIAVLKKLLNEQLASYRQTPDAALKLLGNGESPRNEKLDPAELAAWTMVSSVIINLDEAITKS